MSLPRAVTALPEDSGILDTDLNKNSKEKDDGNLYSARDGLVQAATILNSQSIGAAAPDEYCKRFLKPSITIREGCEHSSNCIYNETGKGSLLLTKRSFHISQDSIRKQTFASS